MLSQSFKKIFPIVCKRISFYPLPLLERFLSFPCLKCCPKIGLALPIIGLLLLGNSVPSIAQQKNLGDTLAVTLDSLYKQTTRSLDNKQYDISIGKATELVELARKNNRYNDVFSAYNMLSINYAALNDTISSLEYSGKALKYAELSKDSMTMSMAYNNYATDLAQNPETRTAALEYYKRSIALSRKLKNYGYLDAASNLARLYWELGNYKMMPPYIREAENSLTPDFFDYKDRIAYHNWLWGDYYMAKGQDKKAKSHYDQAYGSLQSYDFHMENFHHIKRYQDFLYRKGYYKEGLEVAKSYQEKYADYIKLKNQESVQLAKARSQLQESKRERNEAELQQKITDEKLERKRVQNILLGVLIVMLLIFSGYFYSSTNMRKKLIAKLQSNNRELTRARDAAQKSILAKNQFFSTISHEMRTPLYGVTGIASILANSSHIKGHEEDLQSLKFSANHLLDIINDLLDISKLEDKNFGLVKRPFDVRLLIREIVNSFDQHKQKGKTDITFTIDPSTPNYVVGDSRRISQILLNILGNAVKFTQDGHIELRLTCQKLGGALHSLHFELEDDGIGIAPDLHEDIFNEFKQLDSDDNLEQRGTGLGLPIVKKLLEKMDSAILLESQVGAGSRFSFDLVLAEATEEEVSDFGGMDSNTDMHHYDTLFANAAVLIVDDNKINRLVTKKVLSSKNAEITEAASGEEALKKVRNATFDLILMDINMPGMDGFDTSLAIRSFDTEVPIIALTAADAGVMEQRIAGFGMNGFIIKPYNMDEFLKVVVVHLSRRMKEQEVKTVVNS